MSFVSQYWLDLLSIPAHIIGVIGMACVVYGYYGLEKGWLTRDKPILYIINLVGAIFLLLSLVIHFNFGSIIIEFFWIAISIAGLNRLKDNDRNKIS